MGEDNKGNVVIILLSIISLLVISMVALYLFFFNTGNKEEKEEGLPLYKYEVYSGEYRYYTNKIDANKIGLSDTLYYKCESNECDYATSLFSLGNVYNTKAVIKDGNTYLIYDFDKKEKTEITDKDTYKYVDFISDGKYLFINNNDKYYAYNIKEKTISSEIVTDILVLNSNNKPYIVWDTNIVTVDNNKYGIVSLTSGNNLYENDYDSIKCYADYCLLSKDELSNLYVYEKNDTEAVIKDIKEVKFFNNKYLAYYQNLDLIIYSLSTKEETKISNFNDSYIIESIDIKDSAITIRFHLENDIKSKELVTQTDSSEKTINELEEFANDIYSDLFFTSKNKTNITLKSGTTAYDYKMDDKGNIYDNIGTIYDNVSIKNKLSALPKEVVGTVVNRSEAYDYLNKLSSEMKLNNKEKMIFINKYLPILLRNEYNLVSIETSLEVKVYDNINVLTNSDSFLYLKIIIRKADKKTKSSEEESIEFERKDNNIIFISGFSY